MKKLISVVGARPNFMKVAPVCDALQHYSSSLEHRILHTGQHYDHAMSKVFFEHLNMPEPDFYLGIGSDSHARQTGRIMIESEKVFEEYKPDMVIVVGDVNSTVACSLVAVKMGIKVAHVEAGLRSNDRTMPEEINRLVTDSISDLLLVSEPSGLRNLEREGVPSEKLFFVGNTMIDSLIRSRENALKSDILQKFALSERGYILVTLHRPVNVDSRENLEKIVSIFEEVSEAYQIVFPIHPRTRKMAEQFGLSVRFLNNPRFHLMEPLGYLDFIRLLEGSALVLTDSGGIQEETTFLRVPCITLRESTERPITVEIGTNELSPLEIRSVVAKIDQVRAGQWKKGEIPELWDGNASTRISKIFHQYLMT